MKPIGDGAEIPDDIDPAVLEGWENQLEQLRADYDQALDRFQDAQQHVNDLTTKRNQWQGELDSIFAQIPGAQAAAASTKQQVADLAGQLGEYRPARDAATARLLGTDKVEGVVATTQPLLLLPVRLESRFVRTG